MSIEVMSLVLHHSRAKGTDKLVLLGIANHAGDGGAWPTVATLATYANVDARNVQRSVQRLVGLGELAVHVQEGGTANLNRHQRPNRYEVLVGCPFSCDRSPNHRPRPLPQAQSELWTDPPAPASPPGVGVTRPPGVGVTRPLAPASPKPSNNPHPPTVSSNLTVSRASSTPPCTECAAPSLEVCIARQAKLRREDRHTYTPRPVAS